MHDLSISQQLNTTLADVSHTNQHNTKKTLTQQHSLEYRAPKPDPIKGHFNTCMLLHLGTCEASRFDSNSNPPCDSI